ncbi:MAG: hypothetical protein ABIH76_06155 [Candidatus Bathyarchaeota archaeon]
MGKEKFSGNIEHKLRLVNVSIGRLEEITTPLKYRLEEGMGEAICELGVSDDGKIIGLRQADMRESLVLS